MKMAAEYIADVKEASNNYLDISYKTKSAPEQHDKVKYITRALQIELGPEQMHLVLVFNRLNEKGQSIAVERIEELDVETICLVENCVEYVNYIIDKAVFPQVNSVFKAVYKLDTD